MAGEKKRSHCFSGKNEEGSIRPQHFAPRWGMERKISISAEKTLGKGIWVSKEGEWSKSLRLLGWLYYSFQMGHGQQRTVKKEQGGLSSVSQRRMQWHAVEEEETCRGWIGRRPKVGERGKTRHTLKRCGYESRLTWREKKRGWEVKWTETSHKLSRWIVRTWRGAHGGTGGTQRRGRRREKDSRKQSRE